ncbi:NAD(P)-binding protein [Myriangium duriaei CBS 260.36]|uniref:NAD(P)-binding protein n=1 Tax=Myriangium duriaei CBS 260.36 TaxID=1168546 RepID=A0A9P4MNG6_9PEZI|nr:NAD(P)-binding protein [Myriangium duriaei CBS 260.36]
MAPLLDDGHQTTEEYIPRVLIIGAGSRGNGYSRAIEESGLGIVAAVAEPIAYKRRLLGSKYIWKDRQPSPGQEFESWQDFLQYERSRRSGETNGHASPPINAVYVCVLDEQHVEVVTALAPFGFHIMCEKPLATTLKDCLSIYTSLSSSSEQQPSNIFGIGHVLRYSPHNMLLRDLVLEKNVIGDVLSIEHTEPVGWWHYSHSYVRGNWRKESSTAPSLLTKSCHDIDWLLWMMCSPPRTSPRAFHLPAFLSSTGALTQFKKARKPAAAGSATNCLACPIENTCMYSAPKIYHEKHLAKNWTAWPVDIVNPEIETCHRKEGPAAAKTLLMSTLAEDYDDSTSAEKRSSRPWFGRCVWESDNDVCDDQFVTITWENQADETEPSRILNAKTATFHMIAGTEKQCERRGRIYGDKGEIEYDGTTIRVHDFATGSAEVFQPPRAKGGHGGGDDGLVRQFLQAVIATDTRTMTATDAQVKYLGCTLEEVVRSHAMVFAAEEARKARKVVEWQPWWTAQIDAATST